MPWRDLGRDEPLGVVAPSGPVDAERLHRGLARLREWGRPLVLASNLGAQAGYLAGDDDQRAGGLLEVVERGARVVLACRGGYGAGRLLPRLPLTALAERGLCLVGFSDLTAILAPLAASAPQVHGPMVAAGLERPANSDRLLSLLEGRLRGKPLFSFGRAAVARPGRAQGIAAGGNLSLLTSLLGTPAEPRLDGTVLLLEEVGEPLYRLDRMLTQLARSASFGGVKALITGNLHRCRPAKERARAWRQRLLELAPAGSPVVVGLPFGHGAVNMAFPLGVAVEVDTDRGQVRWS